METNRNYSPQESRRHSDRKHVLRLEHPRELKGESEKRGGREADLLYPADTETPAPRARASLKCRHGDRSFSRRLSSELSSSRVTDLSLPPVRRRSSRSSRVRRVVGEDPASPGSSDASVASAAPRKSADFSARGSER